MTIKKYTQEDVFVQSVKKIHRGIRCGKVYLAVAELAKVVLEEDEND